ncbi:hypothetical protein SAMN05428949_2065 [Chitinophaga sp. YR627]|nr:hypothetical protein SAMN05428949_2065 [Chitinophaga sp. YR627]
MRWSVLRDMIAAYLRYLANKVPIHYILCNDLNYFILDTLMDFKNQDIFFPLFF